MKWTKHDQSLFEILSVALTAFKRLGWITLEEHEKIHHILQTAIDRGDKVMG